MDNRALAAWIFMIGAATTAVASAFFLLYPGMDMTVAGFFAGPAGNFPTRLLPEMKAARWAFRLSTDGVALVTVCMLLLHGFGVRLGKVRELSFIVTAYLLGPGLLVNLGLKGHWGRARPRSIAEFGGDALFTPALTRPINVRRTAASSPERLVRWPAWPLSCCCSIGPG